MMLKRVMGKACFATLQDGSSATRTAASSSTSRRTRVGAEALAAFKHWDLGDILGCEGMLFRTKTGELSVKATARAAADQEPAPAARQVPRHEPTRNRSTASATST